MGMKIIPMIMQNCNQKPEMELLLANAFSLLNSNYEFYKIKSKSWIKQIFVNVTYHRDFCSMIICPSLNVPQISQGGLLDVTWEMLWLFGEDRGKWRGLFWSTPKCRIGSSLKEQSREDLAQESADLHKDR